VVDLSKDNRFSKYAELLKITMCVWRRPLCQRWL